MPSASRRFDRIEVVLIAMFIAIVAVTAGQQLGRLATPAPAPSPEARWLAERYGPEHQSQWLEEWIVRDFFDERRDGVFVDIGAAHPRRFSNTWYLERHLGWSGVAVDAQREFADLFASERPRTRFRTFFVTDTSSDRVALFMNSVEWVASSTPDFTRRWGALVEEREVTTITLDDLLRAERVERIDFLSMDIELAEPGALAGFDLVGHRPGLVCIEGHPEVRQVILDYFATRDYGLVGKYLRVDDRNLWFAPVGTEVRPFPPDVTEQWTH